MENKFVHLIDVWTGEKKASKSLRVALRLFWTIVFGFSLWRVGAGTILEGATFAFMLLAGVSFLKMIKWGAFDD